MKVESFPDAIHRIRQQLLDGEVVNRGEWQSKRDDRPQTRVLETYNVSFTVSIPTLPSSLARDFEPNLPWAEDHFNERVGGEPLNPGDQYKNWPWYEQGVEEHKQPGKFSHTYMERMWGSQWPLEMEGHRQMYGDLQTVVDILFDRPYSRQAFLPIWWPEDSTAALRGERVPCTLGYHFQGRPNPIDPNYTMLDVFYPMRSCDFFRYLRDDAYMAGRLLQWVVSQLENTEEGTLTMHIANLHIFEDEADRIQKEYEAETLRRLTGAF